MRRWVGRILIGVLAALLIGLVVNSYRPQPVLVDAAEARKGPLLSSLEQEARARVAERYAILAPVAGALQRIELHPGDAVSAGAPLARLQPLPSAPLDERARADARARAEAAEDAKRQADERVGVAVESLAQARRESERLQKLEAGVSAQQREAAEHARRRAERELASARFAAQVAAHQLEGARAVLRPPGDSSKAPEEVTLASPIDGLVLRVLHEDSGPVAAGTPLLELGDLSLLEVVSELETRDAVAVKPGMRVVFEQWGGPGRLEGRVRRVEPSAFTRVSPLGVEEQRVNVVVDLAEPLERRMGLGDGYELEARFVLWEGADVLQVPASATFRRGEGWAVFRIAGGEVEERPVKLGHRNPADVEVLEGLEAGDLVVLHPAETLKAGDAVRPR